jgi:hypothetical protein
MSWSAAAGKRGATGDDGEAPSADGVLAASGVREPAPQATLAELPLGPDENAMAVSACGRFVAIDARACVNRVPRGPDSRPWAPADPPPALEFVLLNVRNGERFDCPKTVAGRYAYAFSEQDGGGAVVVVAVTSGHSGGVVAGGAGVEVPAAAETVLYFVSGPRWSADEIAPLTLPGEINLLEGARGGLVVATLCGTGEAVVVRLLPSKGTISGWSAPVGVVQLLRDEGGRRIDAVVDEPPPASATNRFYVTSDTDGGFRAAPAGNEAAVVSRVAGSLAPAAAEVFQVPRSSRSFISLGRPSSRPRVLPRCRAPRGSPRCRRRARSPPAAAGLGRPLIDYGLAVGAVLWRSPLELYLVLTDDIVPMLVPLCRGSGAVGAAIFPDKAPLMKRLSYAALPVATAGSVLLCHGRAYMVVE